MSGTNPNVSRRQFMQVGSMMAAVAGSGSWGFAQASPAQLPILRTLKMNMVQMEGSLEDKFRAVKNAGYDGIELDSPGVDVEATRAAIAKTGLVVDGTVCSTHWRVKHSSPDAGERARALEDLKTAIRQTRAVGGHSVLLVAGHGDDGPEAEIWPRTIENISKALPLAAEHGIYIAFENVWNKFLYEHDGPANQTADKFAKYVDEFASPWVGVHFDIGNHWKYGDPAAWARTLGKRIVKLDIKGYSRAKGTWTRITEADINWADMRAALREIRFTGWCAAEVKGGGPEELKEIAGEINRVLELKA